MIVGEHEEAVRLFRKSIVADGNRHNPFYLWGCLLYRTGDWTAAAEKCRQAMAVDSGSLNTLLGVLALHQLIENPDEAPTLVEDTRRLVEADGDPMIQARWLAISGETDLALDQLVQAVKETPNAAVDARFRPAFHTLRDHPRFLELTADAPGSKWDTDG